MPSCVVIITTCRRVQELKQQISCGDHASTATPHVVIAAAEDLVMIQRATGAIAEEVTYTAKETVIPTRQQFMLQCPLQQHGQHQMQ